jgi:GrpB-like predicted nucleotidyltransferase (UPF0157 family)
LHVVGHDGRQWQNYLLFRDLLRQSPAARERYEAVKLGLAETERDDRTAYTAGKTGVVSSLHGGPRDPPTERRPPLDA